MIHHLTSKHFILCAIMVILLCPLITLEAQSSNLRKPVTLNCMDEPISSVLNTLSKLSGTNIVLATDQTDLTEKEQKRVTLNIREVPIETAVSLVAKSAGLSYKIYGDNTFLVGTLQNISESAGEQSHIIYLNYLDAEKVSKA